MTIWVIESGEYEQRGVDGVALSPDHGLQFLQDRYKDPYVVKWLPLERNGNGASVTGQFEAVQGFSIKHTCRFDMTEHEVYGA